MLRRHISMAVLALIIASQLGLAEDHPLETASGTVFKATANVLFIQPRGPDGKFSKKLPLKLRGTSKVYTLSTQMREGQLVPVQREADVKDLQPNQVIAVIYTTINDEPVLLSAVVHPAGK